MALKHISEKTARKKYGIHVSDRGRYYLRDDGCIVDHAGLVRYRPPLSQTMPAESYTLFVEVHDYCVAFICHSMFDFRDGVCGAACPFYPSNNENGPLPMCTVDFIQDHPGTVRKILDAEKRKERCNGTGKEVCHD